MREILFRAKRIDNGEWEYGGYFKHNNRQKCVIGDYDKPDDFDDLIIFSGFADWNMPRPLNCVKVDPTTVGQYTGLTDKNGKKIFEGDIVRHYNIDELPNEFEIGKIIFVEDECCFKRTCNNGFGKCYISSDCIYEVIGNIHDNPELLEVSK